MGVRVKLNFFNFNYDFKHYLENNFTLTLIITLSQYHSLCYNSLSSLKRYRVMLYRSEACKIFWAMCIKQPRKPSFVLCITKKQ
jgi:hypothetical protein